MKPNEAAFPTYPSQWTTHPNGSVELVYGESGMSILHYHAAHAPDVIPEWFQPPFTAVPTPPEIPFGKDETAADVDLHDLAKCYRKDPCFEITDERFDFGTNDRLKAFAVAVNAWHKAHAEHAAAQERNRYFAWRWEYAAGILTAQPKE